MHIKFTYKGNFKAPQKQTKGSAGIDLFNNDNFQIEIAPQQSVVISTGFSVEIPENYVGIVAVRSSMGFKHNATLANSIGVIDSDYRGEIKVKIINHSDTPLKIDPGERVAQLIIIPYLNIDFEQVDTLSYTERGGNGFGSTGKK